MAITSTKKNSGNPLDDMKPRILIIRLSALGDIIHALPLLAALRGRFPGAHIGWLVEPAGVQLLKGHPLIDALHVFPKKAWREDMRACLRGPLRELVREIRAQHYEIALDVQGLTKSAAWGWLARAPRRIGFGGAESRELSGLLATERVRPPEDLRHVIQRNLALLEPLGIPLAPPEKIVSPVHLPEAAKAKAAQILDSLADVGEGSVGGASRPFVILNPGAGWATKVWAPERYGRLARILIDRFQARIAVAWGPGEQPLVCQTLLAAGAARNEAEVDFDAATVPPGPGVYPLPPTSFIELGAVIARSCLFVGGDTGPTHLAAALGVPTVSMMGPLDARRNGPFGSCCVTIQHGVPRKAPFWRNHRRWCDLRTDLAQVTVEEVLGPCIEVLQRQAGVSPGVALL